MAGHVGRSATGHAPPLGGRHHARRRGGRGLRCGAVRLHAAPDQPRAGRSPACAASAGASSSSWPSRAFASLARAWAWSLCTEGPTPLRIRDTFPALVTGDALGNLTPLGLFVSEPTKAVFVRHRVPLMTAVSGLAIENLLYTLTVALVIGSGTVALLFSFDVSRAFEIVGARRRSPAWSRLLAVAAWVLGRQVQDRDRPARLAAPPPPRAGGAGASARKAARARRPHLRLPPPPPRPALAGARAGERRITRRASPKSSSR